jgi:hypothetical protein
MVETSADGGEPRTVEYDHDGLGRVRVIRDFANPAAPIVTELTYDLLTVSGIWQR